LNDDAAEFLQFIMSDDLRSCNWESVISNLNWLQSWVDLNGPISDVKQVFEEYLADVAVNISQHVNPALLQSHHPLSHDTPLPRAPQRRKARKCMKCFKEGHQKNLEKCRMNSDDFSLKSPSPSHTLLSTGRTPPTGCKVALASP
jgi:hypothetical protein